MAQDLLARQQRAVPIVDPRSATAEQLIQFSQGVRQRLGLMNEDELNQLEALLLAAARRLRQLRASAAEADRTRIMVLVQIGELLGEGKPGAPEGNRNRSMFDKANIEPSSQADRKRRHAARLLYEHRSLVDGELARPNPPTLSRLVRLCQRRRAGHDVPLPDATFSILYVDPPWQYEYAETGNRQIENHYGTMPLTAIKELQVPAADDAVLFCWATSPKLAEALAVVAAWRFEYRTCMVWVKDKIGMGYYARQQHELLLIAKRGNLPPPAPHNRPSSVFYGDRDEHSAKPDHVYELIEAMYPEYDRGDDHTEFCELFARRSRKGWAHWGNEASGK